MKPKTLVLMGVAIACGLGASYMTARLLAERNTADDPKIAVLVAKKPLNIGDSIKSPEDVFQVKQFIKGDEPMGAVNEMNDLKNRVLKRPLRVGDHVTQDDLLNPDDTGGNIMPIVLPVGYRAVGLRVNLESIAHGFASLPLSRVDVISTVARGDDKTRYSQVLLEDVLVLAADANMKRSEDGKPMPSQVVTLALKPEDALKVRLAAEMGPLSLMLRKINDKSHAEHSKLTGKDLKQGSIASPEPSDEETPKPAPPVQVVQAPKEPAPEKLKAPELSKHVIAVSEGGRTRHFDYFYNDHGEIVQPNSVNPAPPAPLESNDKK